MENPFRREVDAAVSVGRSTFYLAREKLRKPSTMPVFTYAVMINSGLLLYPDRLIPQNRQLSANHLGRISGLLVALNECADFGISRRKMWEAAENKSMSGEYTRYHDAMFKRLKHITNIHFDWIKLNYTQEEAASKINFVIQSMSDFVTLSEHREEFCKDDECKVTWLELDSAIVIVASLGACNPDIITESGIDINRQQGEGQSAHKYLIDKYSSILPSITPSTEMSKAQNKTRGLLGLAMILKMADDCDGCTFDKEMGLTNFEQISFQTKQEKRELYTQTASEVASRLMIKAAVMALNLASHNRVKRIVRNADKGKTPTEFEKIVKFNIHDSTFRHHPTILGRVPSL